MKLSLKTILAVLLLLASASAFADSSYLKEFEKSPLPQIKPPHVTKVSLKNGATLFLLEDHTLPIIRMNAMLKSGSIYDPKKKEGLAEMAVDLMRSGGAGNLGPEEFDAALDDLGAQLSIGAGRDDVTAAMEILSKDLDQGLGLFFDMLFKPKFDPDRLAVVRAAYEEALRREEDEPATYSSKIFRQTLYGKNNPWGSWPTKTSLKNISLDDIRTFQKKYFLTNNIIIAAAGNFDSNKLIKMIEEKMTDAPKGEVKFPEVQAVKLEFIPETVHIDKDTKQTFIRMGHLGVRRHNPDIFALFLMNDILGASNFKSRLMEDIRTKRGLAYSVGSKFAPGTDYGVFVVGVNTKPTQAAEVTQRIKDHIANLAGDGDVTDDELSFAKKSVLSRLVFDFDSAFKVATQQESYMFYDYPGNYWKIYRDKTSKVTKSDIKRVSKEYLHPDGLKIITVGPVK